MLTINCITIFFNVSGIMLDDTAVSGQPRLFGCQGRSIDFYPLLKHNLIYCNLNNNYSVCNPPLPGCYLNPQKHSKK